MLTISNLPDGTSLTMVLEGRIDTQTAPDLEKAITESTEGITELVLDFAKVHYLSSAGLRVILASQNLMEQKGGTMIIRGAVRNIKDIFKVTGFDSFLTLE